MSETLIKEMQKFYIGKKEYLSKYILEKKYITSQNKKIKLYSICMVPKKKKIISQILISHRMGDNSRRFIEISKNLADKGIITYLYDFRGFGFSSGGIHFSTLNEFLEDFKINLKYIRTDLPLFLFGHAFSAGFILLFLKLNPDVKISGVILNNPYFQFPPSVFTKLEIFLIPFIPRFLDGTIITTPNISPHLLVKSDKALKNIYEDKNFQLFSSFKILKTFYDLSKNLYKTNFCNFFCRKKNKNGNDFNYSCLCIIGKLDVLSLPVFCKEYFKHMKCRDFILKEYDGFHDVIFDEGEEICDDIYKWILERKNNFVNFGILNRIFRQF